MTSWISCVAVSFRGMSLRSRLVMAFVLLILSSASATIVIGNSVFGTKVDQLASNVMTVYAGVATQVLQGRLDRMRDLARNMAALHAGGADPHRLAEAVPREIPLDFLVLTPPTGRPTIVRLAAGNEGAAPDGLPDSLATAVQEAAASQGCVAGFVDSGRGTLTAVAAAPLAEAQGAVVLGYTLNGKAELLRQVQSLLPGGTDQPVEVTAFLGTRGVASTAGTPARTAVPEEIAAVVLRDAETFTGMTERDEKSYIAYLPLKDLSGGVVGMVGLVNREDALADARKRTTTLFTSLIAGGMFFGFIMSLIFSAWLVSPISQLAAGVTRVSEGDLDHKVRIESSDELGKLARAFNQMVRGIKERDHKLRELTESRLSQVEKQVSVGRLAAGVAHEINNPLTAILAMTNLWLRKMPADDAGREDLQMVVNETARCRDIVRSLLDFARESPTDKCLVDINSVVRETVALARKCEPFAGVMLESRLPALPLTVNADPKLLQQVFLNLLINAAEAVEPGGTVRVETDEDSSGGFVQVKVIDNGKGIPKEHINRVFEPFFTTKGTGKGTGLGLSVSAGIVHKHDGAIDIESEEGAGTTVTVLIPHSSG